MASLHDVIVETRVLDLGPLPAPRLSPKSTIHQALQMLRRGRRGAVVLIDRSRPVGIFTERDVVNRLRDDLVIDTERRSVTPVREVMSHPALTVSRQETLRAAIELMVRHACRHLVVVDRDDELRGLLTTNDVVQYLTDQFPEETVFLPPRLHQQYSRPEGG